MARTKTLIISQPFDPRHVSGVNIFASTITAVGVQRSLTSTLEPDETPTHIDLTSHPPPRRSNSFAHGLSRPSLRLRHSISRLRGRSSSTVPHEYRSKERDSTPEHQHASPLSEPRTYPTSAAPIQLITNQRAGNRPKRADSGTAIDFDGVPLEQRPLDFQQIQAIKNVEERLRSYRCTRDYWASADHGLDDWVGRARRPLVVRT
jgi:hypothetical protein